MVVIDQWAFEAPRTKDAIAALGSLGVDGRILVVLADGDVNAAKSFRNLQHVHVMHVSELNTYDVLVSDWVVFSKQTVPVESVAAAAPAAAEAPTPKPDEVAAEPEEPASESDEEEE